MPRDIQYSNDTSTSGRHDPLGDVQPPFAMDRPGMSRVTVPVVERTKFSSSAAQSSTIHLPSQQQSTIRSPSPIPTEEPDTTNSITAQKRKRSDVDDNSVASQFSDASAMLPPPKQSKCGRV